MTATALFEKTQLGKIHDSKPARLTIKEFQNQRLFITKVGGGAKPNYQLMYSLGDDIFLNTFSERLSMWELSGLHIMADCDGEDVPGEPPFLTFYKTHNIKTEAVVNMSFAGVTMRGYLVNMQIQDYNQNGIEGFQFNLKYLAFIQNLADAANQPSSAGAGVAAGVNAANAAAGGSGNLGGLSDRELAILRSAASGLVSGRPPVSSGRLGIPDRYQIGFSSGGQSTQSLSPGAGTPRFYGN